MSPAPGVNHSRRSVEGSSPVPCYDLTGAAPGPRAGRERPASGRAGRALPKAALRTGRPGPASRSSIPAVNHSAVARPGPGRATPRGMNVPDPKIGTPRRPIRQLDAAAANRIAAGEVVERPASAVKELIENALDAGARRIDVAFADGGKRLIRVQDDGQGIPADELPLALERHATSKIDGTDLTRILTFGFRGEALPSLGAVGRLTVTSRAAGAPEGAALTVRGGVATPLRPAALARGTVVELEGLFSATPARLKFLRSDRAEAQAIGEVVRRLAIAAPGVGFTLTDRSDEGAPRELLRLDPEPGDLFDGLGARLRAVVGAGLRRQRAADRGRARRHRARRARRLADLLARRGGGAVPVRQRPAGARQAALRRAARRLRRPARPRPPPGGGAVPELRARGGRRQRPPGQGRGPLPRPGSRPRPRRRRAAPGARRRRPPRRLDHRQRHARRLPPGPAAPAQPGGRAGALGAGTARPRLRRDRPARAGRRRGSSLHRSSRPTCRSASPAPSCTRPT